MARTRCAWAAAGLLLSLATLPGSAAALPLEVTFAGTITSVDAALASQFNVGDPVSGQASVDSETLDSDPSPSRGEYVGLIVTAQFGSYVISGVAFGSSAIGVMDGTAGGDEFRISGVGLTAPDVGAFEPSVLGVVLLDSSATVFSGTALPTSLQLADFDITVISLSFLESGVPTPALVMASITSISAVVVPEPTSRTLLPLGVLALAALRTRR